MLARGLAVLLLELAPLPALAQLVVGEAGFAVTTLPPGAGAKGIECSPGGAWGDFVYVADSTAGQIERIDFSDNVTVFATGLQFPVGMDFGPGPLGGFGDFLYVADFNASEVARINLSGTVTSFAAITGGPGDVKFDPSGAYGADLFTTNAGGPPIWVVDSSGTSAIFSLASSLYLRFGPGGAWGSGLYATDTVANGIAKLDSLGASTPFVSGFTTPEGFDWASGPGFGGDMFLADVGGGQIYRIRSDGTSSVFATLAGAADVAFCNGDLYAVSLNGGCFKIEYPLVVPAMPPLSLWLVALIAVVVAATALAKRSRSQPV